MDADAILGGGLAGEQAMDAPVELFHKRSALLLERQLEARGSLARSLARVVSVDGQSLSGVSVGPTEMAARQKWLAGTVDALSSAPTVDAFKLAINERVEELFKAFPDEPGAASRVTFRGVSAEAFRAGNELVDKHPRGSVLWESLAAEDPVSSRSHALAVSLRTAKLSATGVNLQPESGLEAQKTEIMKRFGLNAIAFEGPVKSPAEQSFILDRMVKIMADGARDLGLASESNVGLGGTWALRVIDHRVNEKLLGQAGYVRPSRAEPVLALSVKSKDPGTFKHEWTHMLDLKLGQQAREKAAKDPLISEVMKKIASEEVLFSRMPQQVQQLMPKAFEGYWQVAAAAQGLPEGASLRSIELERNDRFDALSRRVQSRLLANPALMTGLGKAERAELDDKMTGAVKNLMTNEKMNKSLRMDGATSPYDFAAELHGQDGPKIKWAMDDLGRHLEEKFGPAWRTGADGFESSVYDQLARGLNKAVAGVEAAEIKGVMSMWGANGMPLSPESRFAQASHHVDVTSGNVGYWNSAHEMFARVIGRPKSLTERVDALSNLMGKVRGYWNGEDIQAEDKSLTRAFRNALAPELDGQAQRMVRDGFAKMTVAAGLGEAELRIGVRERVESAMLSAPGQMILVKAANAVQVLQRADAVCGKAVASMMERVDSGIGVFKVAVGHINKGIGALAAFGAYSSGSEAIKEAKAGQTGAAVLSGVESAGSVVVVGGALAGAVGIAKAAPLTRLAGPVGAALGYMGAVKAAGQALSAQKAGLKDEANRHWQGAGIRAAGATGSLVAGMAAGAAMGSVVPLAGTAVGAVAGIAVAYAAEKWAESVEAPVAPVQPVLPSIGLKLTARRAMAAESVEVEVPVAPVQPVPPSIGSKLAARRAMTVEVAEVPVPSTIGSKLAARRAMAMAESGSEPVASNAFGL